MAKVNRRKIADLDVYEVPGDPAGDHIVLFHGYGANAHDLIPLAGISKKHTWVFPDAPLEVPIGMGYVGRAWFPIDQETLQKGGTVESFPEELVAYREVGEAFIAQLGIPLASLYLGGFSQGAVLATELALEAEENCAGLVVLSGILVQKKRWEEGAKRHAGLPFFQSHGTGDPLLPLSHAEALERVLLEGGMRGKLHTFAGGHEIPQSVLFGLKDFLQA